MNTNALLSPWLPKPPKLNVHAAVPGSARISALCVLLDEAACDSQISVHNHRAHGPRLSVSSLPLKQHQWRRWQRFIWGGLSMTSTTEGIHEIAGV